MRPAEPKRRLSRTEIARIVDSFREIRTVIQEADTASKALICKEIGLLLTYKPNEKSLIATATPPVGNLSCPRGELNPHVR